MRFTALAAVAATLSTLVTGPAIAANQTFTDATAFDLAAGATRIESFEAPGVTARVRSTADVVTQLFTVTPQAALIGIQNGPDSPESGFGAFAVDGSQYLLSYNPNVPTGTLKFTFNAPTQVFGFAMTDVGEAAGVVSLRTNAGAFTAEQTLATFGNGNALFPGGSLFFFGLTQDVAFTEAYVTVTGVDDAFGLDAVRISAVPEPAESALLLTGLALMGGAVRRRRSAPIRH